MKTTAMPPASFGRLMRLATYASVTTALVLIIVKFIAWEATGALSLLAALIDSLLDLAASALNLVAVRHALTPADEEHRFGHGKAEPLAALGQAAFICGSAVFLFVQAIERLIKPAPLEHGAIGVAVMIFSILATLGLVTFQKYVVSRTKSLAISADSLHYQGDILMNGAVIAALILSTQFGWLQADPLFALGIAAYIVYNAWLIGRDALNMLMDRELPEEERSKIRAMILEHPEVLGLHDLRTRASGPQTFIQCHVEMNGELRLWDAHEVADRIEKQLMHAFPGAQVIVHEDPFLEQGKKQHQRHG